MNLLNGVNEVHIAVTHCHPDHIGSLGSLIFYCHFIKKIKPIFHAANSDFIELLEIMGVTEDHCEFDNCAFDPTVVIDSLDLGFYFLENNHVKELMTFGILLAKNPSEEEHEYVIYYSGDSCDIEDNIMDGFKEGKINYLYQDTCKTDYDGNVHLSLRKLCELIQEDLRSKVWCMHLDSGFDNEEAERLGFNVVEIEEVVK